MVIKKVGNVRKGFFTSFNSVVHFSVIFFFGKNFRNVQAYGLSGQIYLGQMFSNVAKMRFL